MLFSISSLRVLILLYYLVKQSNFLCLKILSTDFCISIDKIFLYIQYVYVSLLYKKKLNYILFFGGWGQLVQSVFFTYLLNKKDLKLILVLDYQKFNLNLQDFSPSHKIMKLYSLFKLVNKDFAQYPLYIQQDIKIL